MRSHARAVIVGGGIMGVGLLYHLALEGWTDVVLIEKGELTSGSTWHAAGQCPHFNSSLNVTKVHVYGTQLYPKLEELTGQAVSWHGCGGLRLATTDEEVDWLKYVYGISRLAGYECEIIGPNAIKKYHPQYDDTLLNDREALVAKLAELGVTYKPPLPNGVQALAIRPEIRFDDALDGAKPYNDGKSDTQFTFGIDFILKI